MSVRYCHTLIPQSPDYTASPTQVQAFLRAMTSRGVMGGTPELVLRTPSTRTLQVVSRFAGTVQSLPRLDRRQLNSIDEIEPSLLGLRDYEVEASGTGRPKSPPPPLDFDGDYYIAVICRSSSQLRSTSDLQDPAPARRHKAPFYGDITDRVVTSGFFTNPHNLDIIEVLGAGCAHFWIEFELGSRCSRRSRTTI